MLLRALRNENLKNQKKNIKNQKFFLKKPWFLPALVSALKHENNST
jgi:hypothetical protein